MFCMYICVLSQHIERVVAFLSLSWKYFWMLYSSFILWKCQVMMLSEYWPCYLVCNAGTATWVLLRLAQLQQIEDTEGNDDYQLCLSKWIKIFFLSLDVEIEQSNQTFSKWLRLFKWGIKVPFLLQWLR